MIRNLLSVARLLAGDKSPVFRTFVAAMVVGIAFMICMTLVTVLPVAWAWATEGVIVIIRTVAGWVGLN